MRNANYQLVTENEKFRLLRDVGPWDAYPTITNAAERTVKDEHLNGLGEKRLLYIDSEGDYTELVHDNNGTFVTFAFVVAMEVE